MHESVISCLSIIVNCIISWSYAYARQKATSVTPPDSIIYLCTFETSNWPDNLWSNLSTSLQMLHWSLRHKLLKQGPSTAPMLYRENWMKIKCCATMTKESSWPLRSYHRQLHSYWMYQWYTTIVSSNRFGPTGDWPIFHIYLFWKLGPYRLVSGSSETVTTADIGNYSVEFPDRASIASQSGSGERSISSVL